MDFRDRLRRGLEHSRGFTDHILGEISRPEDWMRRPVPQSNHALWIAGHLGLATDYFVGLVDPSRQDSRDEWATLFGKGSQPLDDIDAYPSPEVAKDYLTERGHAFVALLDECPEEDFTREVPKGPKFMHDVAAVFQMAAWHETLHAGQLTVIHRMLGLTPIADRK